MVINQNIVCIFGKLKNQTIMTEIEIEHNGHDYLVEYSASIENYYHCDGDRETPPYTEGDVIVEIHKAYISDNDGWQEIVAGAPIYPTLAELINNTIDFNELCEIKGLR